MLWIMKLITDDVPTRRLAFDQSDRLAKALKIAGVTSNDMAEHLHISRNTVSNYITGRTEPKYSVLRDWAMFTGVPLEWITKGVDPDEQPPKFRTMDYLVGSSNVLPLFGKVA